jgi:FtsZ-binding cell division protein ZapB
MDEPSASAGVRRSVFPWVIVAMVIFASGGAAFWMNQKIEVLQAAVAKRQEIKIDKTGQAIATLQRTTEEIQIGQQKLSEQVSELQRRVATGQGERKLLSDQLGSFGERLNALASSRADLNSTVQQPQKNRRSKQ